MKNAEPSQIGSSMYVLYFTKDAQKDAKKVSKPNLKDKIKVLFRILEINPLQNPPPFKKLRGKLTGTYSRRINLHHRLFYEIDEVNKRVKIIRMWTHYGDN